ncbi:hypothetical protein I8751_08105 [Nostocaceae cyanobacterium CENA357]|uniref:Uncharacterized protein n=1 Tax=Atlanticothrix silvestris CENA357 TaxID=1725252 RepID=A0A8J7L4T2_9CYAN|nr:hypothetical protein [Atlanticothrix silvestris]MBH8552337.1 hypothetical protein [Atlanticothrix silvestris CENA357]
MSQLNAKGAIAHTTIEWIPIKLKNTTVATSVAKLNSVAIALTFYQRCFLMTNNK